MLFTQTIKSQNVAKPHSSGEETLWHNGRTCPDSGLHCGIGSHCLTDSCRKNEEEEEEESNFRVLAPSMWGKSAVKKIIKWVTCELYKIRSTVELALHPLCFLSFSFQFLFGSAATSH